MQSSDFADYARSHRSSGAVLKVRVSNVRSKNATAIIAVVEGATDVAPYEVWISRISQQLQIEFIPGTGKSQLLDFRRRMKEDRLGLNSGIYLLVDRDFDGLRGQGPAGDMFCTESYSVENYLVSASILRSILTDEFRCTAESDHRDEIVDLFESVLDEFNFCMRDANRRILGARRLGIYGGNIEERISRYVDIALEGVDKTHNEENLRELIRFETEPDLDEVEELNEIFESLDPVLSYRGKFLLAFFMAWLSKLADERKREGQTLFPETASTKFSTAKLSLRSLASRASLPGGLEDFVRSMRLN